MSLEYAMGVLLISASGLVFGGDQSRHDLRRVMSAEEARYRQILDRTTETKQSEDTVPWSEQERQQQVGQAQAALVDLLNSRMSGVPGQYTPSLVSPAPSTTPFSPASGFSSPAVFAAFAPVTGATPVDELPQFVQYMPVAGQPDSQ
jgi:hypothetical protein